MEGQTGATVEPPSTPPPPGGDDKTAASPISLDYRNNPGTQVVYDKAALKEMMSINSVSSGKETEAPKIAEATPAKVEAPETKATKEPPAISELTFKVGDKEVKLPENAIVKVMVDGKELDVAVADLKREYQGKIPWNQRFGELKEEKRKFNAERATWQSQRESEKLNLKEFVTDIQKDPWGGIIKLLIKAGHNPATYLPKYLEQAEATTKAIASLSKEQRDLIVQTKMVEFDRELLDKQKKAGEAEKAQKEAEGSYNQYFSSKVTEHGFSEKELNNATELLIEMDEDPKQPFKFSDDPKKRADKVFEYILKVDRPFSRIEKIVTEVAPSLRKEAELLHDIYKTTLDTYPDMTDSELREIVLGVVGESQTANKPDETDTSASTEPSTGKSRVATKPSKPTPGKTPQKAKEKSEAEELDYNPMSMDDIVRRYRGK